VIAAVLPGSQSMILLFTLVFLVQPVSLSEDQRVFVASLKGDWKVQNELIDGKPSEEWLKERNTKSQTSVGSILRISSYSIRFLAPQKEKQSTKIFFITDVDEAAGTIDLRMESPPYGIFRNVLRVDGDVLWLVSNHEKHEQLPKQLSPGAGLVCLLLTRVTSPEEVTEEPVEEPKNR
tara:strand:+ start:384 stop:917 length:534 start_codon:yes stop_codon:yes gene_type:complete